MDDRIYSDNGLAPIVFGKAIPGQVYISRPGAYAVLLNESGQVGVVWITGLTRGCYLPGGGIEPDETAEQTLRREMLEECGLELDGARWIGRAVEYLFIASKERYLRIDAEFFTARSWCKQQEPVERDHTLRWLLPDEAARSLVRPAQAWAVQQALDVG